MNGLLQFTFEQFKTMMQGTDGAGGIMQAAVNAKAMMNKFKDEKVAGELGRGWRDSLHRYLTQNTVYNPTRTSIDPHHTAKRSWDSWVLLLVLYSSFSTPLQVGFDLEPSGSWKVFDGCKAPPHLRARNCTHARTQCIVNNAMHATHPTHMRSVCDVVFWVDLALNFISGHCICMPVHMSEHVHVCVYQHGLSVKCTYTFIHCMCSPITFQGTMMGRCMSCTHLN